MSEGREGEPDRSQIGRALALGLGRGLLIFAITAGFALLLGTSAWGLAFRGTSFRLGLDLSWIALAAFNRIGIGFALPAGGLFGGAGGTIVVLHAAALTVTIVIGALGVMFGRRVRNEFKSILPLATGVAAIAVGYALPIWAASALVRPSGSLDVRVISWEAPVLPFALMLGSVTGGAWLPRVRGSVAIALSAGWRAFCAAIVFAFVGFLLTAALSPSKSAAYVRYVTSGGANTVVGGAHILLLPNQSVAILAPAMGGCDVIRDTTRSLVSICGTSIDVDSPVAGVLGFREVDHELGTGYWLFLLVPSLSTLGAGWTMRGPAGRRLTSAALGGVVYAVLVGIASVIASVSVGGSLLGPHGLTAGPEVIVTTLVALAWGVVGISLGSLLPFRRHEPEVPPSPTSV